jgi:F420-0:gamma-glutamyl ligase-like protein
MNKLVLSQQFSVHFKTNENLTCEECNMYLKLTKNVGLQKSCILECLKVAFSINKKYKKIPTIYHVAKEYNALFSGEVLEECELSGKLPPYF